MFVLFVLAFCGSVFLNFILVIVAGLGLSGALETDHMVQEKFVSHNADARDKVVILPIEGLITEAEEGFAKRAIDHVLGDKTVRAVVLRVDSPGGTITGSDYLYHHLRHLAKEREIPLVVSMGGIAASGGYYLSMAVGDTPDSIFAEPTTFTGSIGVVIPHYSVADLMKEHGIEDDSIASHPLKVAGSITRKMSDEERKIFQTIVDTSCERFKDIVKRGRPRYRKDPAQLDKIATGRIYTADQALEVGLVDKLGFVEDAVDRAITLAGLDKENIKVVRYKPEASLRTILMGGEARSRARNVDLQTILEMTTPKAYYLTTWLPGFTSGGK